MKPSPSLPLWLLVATLTVPLLGLTSPLIEVDDARYAQIPAEMLRSGDWVLPTLDGTPYVEKPPLWYWSAGVSYRIFGINEAAARLPMWILSCLGILGVGWLGTWLYSVQVGRAAAAATATAGLWLFLTHNLTLDMPVSVFLLYATALALRAMARPDDARWAAPATWVAAALAFLSKGLIALLLPGLWVLGLCALYPPLRKGARRLISPLGVALATLIAAPWFAAMQGRRPDFLHVFFIEQHFERYLTPKYNRGAPWWFYLAVLPAGLMPWTSAFLAGLWRSIRQPFGTDYRGPALSFWTLGVAVFFSTSHSKLATYVLPVVPHAALLAAVALDQGLPFWAQRFSRTLGMMLLAGGALATATLASGRLPPSWWPPPGLPLDALAPVILLAIAFFLVLGIAQIAAPSLKHAEVALSLAGLCAGIFLFCGLRYVSPLISARDIGTVVRNEIQAEDSLWTYGFYLQGLPFYAHHPVDKLVMFEGEFHYAMRDPQLKERFGNDNHLKSAPAPATRRFVVLRSKERIHFEDCARQRQQIDSWREFGTWSLAVVRARPGGPRARRFGLACAGGL